MTRPAISDKSGGIADHYRSELKPGAAAPPDWSHALPLGSMPADAESLLRPTVRTRASGRSPSERLALGPGDDEARVQRETEELLHGAAENVARTPADWTSLYDVSVNELALDRLPAAERAILAALALERGQSRLWEQYADVLSAAGQEEKANLVLAVGAALPSGEAQQRAEWERVREAVMQARVAGGAADRRAAEQQRMARLRSRPRSWPAFLVERVGPRNMLLAIGVVALGFNEIGLQPVSLVLVGLAIVVVVVGLVGYFRRS